MDEEKTMTRKDGISMIRKDSSAVNGLDDPRFNLVAEFIHLIVENKDKPLDEKEVKLIRELMRLILKNGGNDFIQTLSEVNSLVAKNLFGPKVDATMGRKK